MDILKAELPDLVEIMYLVKQCVIDMNAKGLKNWNTFYPGGKVLVHDLEKKSVFLVKDKGVCKGMITLNNIIPEEYKDINWQNKSDKVLYIHNLAVHPNWQDKGIAKMLLEFAEKYAQENGYTHLRLDIFSKDIVAQELITGNAYIKSGEFYSDYQKTPFVCYEKSI
ncbi:MAG: GNAT family N-acetyltransferase [Bacteroidales bacterium]|nr:GNAT family N-acetyltransferase [Bacteroidales bacterium]